MKAKQTAKQAAGAESSFNSAPPPSSPGRGRPATLVPFVTAAQMAQADRRTMRDYGIGLVQMMELAGRNLATLARERLGGSVEGRQIVVLCGTGNNGGGGMVAARHLHGWGAEVQAALIGSEDALKALPRRQWRILRRLGLAARSKGSPGPGRPDMVIDAIFGYGFHGKPRPRTARWIEWANGQGCPVLALDLPSGLDATTGIPSTPCIRAAVTLTLALPKTGLRAPQAEAFVGELYLADIGVPPEVYRDLGYDVGNPFAGGSIIRLGDPQERSR